MKNLGKEIYLTAIHQKGMIVGVNESKEFIIVSFPNNYFGWGALNEKDKLYIKSPLNKAFCYVTKDAIKLELKSKYLLTIDGKFICVAPNIITCFKEIPIVNGTVAEIIRIKDMKVVRHYSITDNIERMHKQLEGMINEIESKYGSKVAWGIKNGYLISDNSKVINGCKRIANKYNAVIIGTDVLMVY